MQIKVNEGGRINFYDVESYDTIGTLKEKIHSWDGAEVECQILDIDGYVFNNDEDRLADLIEDGDEICLTADVPEKRKKAEKLLGQKESIFAVTARKSFKMSRGSLTEESGIIALVSQLGGENIGERTYQAAYYDVPDGANLEVNMVDDEAALFANGEKQEPKSFEHHSEKEIQLDFTLAKDYFGLYKNWIQNIMNFVQQ